MAAKTQPIIIKRKGGHAGHHGGAWKVAYADFVTAMMSLFIVLWLMGSSEKVKQAVSGYFNDPRGTGKLMGTLMTGTGSGVTIAQASNDQLQKLKDKLEAEIKARKELEKLSKQIEITITPEGLRIELIEGKDGTFYELGSAKLSGSGQELLSLLAKELKTLPNSLLIEGHTDATPYSSDAGYSNWDLSADRANSARRLLQQDGVRTNQVTQVRGYADQMLRMKNSPTDPSNRRISILVKNDSESVPTLEAASVVNGSTPLPGVAQPPAPAANAATPQGAQPAVQAAAQPATQAAATPASKPAPGKPAAKPGLMDKLKNMLPGKKK
ncbi:MAG: flagellar motor protein MotB [Terracidiphilus sp.]|jgi:chemotaxis protein MotB